MNAQLSIIIVEYCSEEEIYKCINSISASLHVPYEIIVSSNSCYGEERQNAIRSKSANNVRWIFNEKNGGFAYAMNQGLKAATGKFLIIMNSDCIVGRGIDEMMLFMQQHPDIGAAGPQIKDNNGNIQDTARPYVSVIRYVLRQVKRILKHQVSILETKMNYDKIQTKGPARVNPLMVPMMISNMAAGNVSIQFGLKGKSLNISTACASGTNAIGEAFRTIQYGDAEVMVAGGTESCITPLGIAGFTSLTALTSSDDPKHASIPFDKNRSGFVMGEGAAIVILEELEHAKKRGAKIYAEVTGYGCSSDAYHITSPAEDGAGAATAMINAMKDAGVNPEEITYINAHGTSTHHNDLFETRAIKLAFGEHAKDIRINSTKSMIGHLLGAAGAIECLTCVKEIEEGYIHATVGYETPDEELDLNYCKEAYEEEVPYAISNSLGFGGHNASILIRRYEA